MNTRPSHFERFTQIVLPGECEFFSYFLLKAKKVLGKIYQSSYLDPLHKEVN